MNVKDALQLGDLQKAKILAGDKGLDRVIKAAEVMEVPDINEWLTEAFLLSLHFIPSRTILKLSLVCLES